MLRSQRRIAAHILKCSPRRVYFNPEQLKEIKEAITKADLRGLIARRAILKKPVAGISKLAISKMRKQRRKGRRKGPGSRQGRRTARVPSKRTWINKIRLQRKFISELREKGIIPTQFYRQLYMKAKGGFFRNKRHIKLFIEENRLAAK